MSLNVELIPFHFDLEVFPFYSKIDAIPFQVGNGFDSFPSIYRYQKTQFEARLPFSLRTSLLLYKNLFPGALQQFLELRNSILYTHNLCYVQMDGKEPTHFGKESEGGKESAKHPVRSQTSIFPSNAVVVI